MVNKWMTNDGHNDDQNKRKINAKQPENTWNINRKYTLGYIRDLQTAM